MCLEAVVGLWWRPRQDPGSGAAGRLVSDRGGLISWGLSGPLDDLHAPDGRPTFDPEPRHRMGATPVPARAKGLLEAAGAPHLLAPRPDPLGL